MELYDVRAARYKFAYIHTHTIQYIRTYIHVHTYSCGAGEKASD